MPRPDQILPGAFHALLLAASAACGAGPPVEPVPQPAPAPCPPPTASPERSPDVPDLHATEASAVVDRQNQAYNRHDIDRFLAAYADSVTVQTLGDTVVVKGKDRLRESTAAWFAEAPLARTEVVSRMVLGPFVVERQRVTGGTSGGAIEVIGIYEVREGLIRRVWSIPPSPTPH